MSKPNMQIPRTATYGKNRDKSLVSHSGEYCLVCGKEVGHTAIYVNYSAALDELVDSLVDANGEEIDDTFEAAVGPDCYRKNPSIHPYRAK